MCNQASFIVTKSKVFFCEKSDSHEDIIKEHKLTADGVRGPNIVRVEIMPPNNDWKLTCDKWRYKVDQDVLPGWYDSVNAERRCRIALKKWYALRVFDKASTHDTISYFIVFLKGKHKIKAVVSGGYVRSQETSQMTIDTVSGGSVRSQET